MNLSERSAPARVQSMNSQAKALRAVYTSAPNRSHSAAEDDHALRSEAVRAGEPLALLASAEERVARLLQGALDTSDATKLRSAYLIARAEARGKALCGERFETLGARRAYVFAALRALAADLGRGPENVRRLTLRRICDWLSWTDVEIALIA